MDATEGAQRAFLAKMYGYYHTHLAIYKPIRSLEKIAKEAASQTLLR